MKLRFAKGETLSWGTKAGSWKAEPWRKLRTFIRRRRTFNRRIKQVTVLLFRGTVGSTDGQDGVSDPSLQRKLERQIAQGVFGEQ